MVNIELAEMYAELFIYHQNKLDNLLDPTVLKGEFVDRTPPTFNTITPVIQDIAGSAPNLVESALLRSYRDIESHSYEYSMRTRKRADYYSDAALEEEVMLNKLKYNQRINDIYMSGRESTS